mmetsp:Transcript_6220/g.16889  ORF Transcript_6220/g.16889 Transcript_6220/m.16889 type:complete len:308 (-) Transcript_6220:264-1187(-)
MRRRGVKDAGPPGPTPRAPAHWGAPKCVGACGVTSESGPWKEHPSLPLDVLGGTRGGGGNGLAADATPLAWGAGLRWVCAPRGGCFAATGPEASARCGRGLSPATDCPSVHARRLGPAGAPPASWGTRKSTEDTARSALMGLGPGSVGLGTCELSAETVMCEDESPPEVLCASLAREETRTPNTDVLGAGMAASSAAGCCAARPPALLAPSEGTPPEIPDSTGEGAAGASAPPTDAAAAAEAEEAVPRKLAVMALSGLKLTRVTMARGRVSRATGPHGGIPGGRVSRAAEFLGGSPGGQRARGLSVN